ncbi:MAG: peptidase-C39 like family protein [Bacteroidetes bacterium]|nr:MAG: peptidase-C39 like family protein [Bacteroidota bacterium]MBL1144469.1 peptidase-C39 like family protein [Bacteroidota bacterium]MCB0745432.1 C39 family peptidase [Ignavibacteriota bacterium]NOG57264.1 peptidase-C39 like family protein [Bacteroidota bacterium]
MKNLKILSQPNDSTCGPTCLQAVYNFYNDPIDLKEVIRQVHTLDNGGTLAVMLAINALKRNYKASIYTYNLEIFDPSWFPVKDNEVIINKLKEQLKIKRSLKFIRASKAYIKFLEMGGELKFKDLSRKLIERLFKENTPVLTGLSATYLYNCQREAVDENNMMYYSDTKGEPTGHFVILSGFDSNKGKVLVADPYKENPVSGTNYYSVKTGRLLNSILLGIMTYDANLLIIKPK